MKTEHTPGPWKTNGSVVTAQHDMRLTVAICVSKEDNRPTVDAAAKTREQAIANARLIASAPALINALESLVSELSERTYKDGRMMSASFVRGEVCSVKALESARIALAKAKGQE